MATNLVSPVMQFLTPDNIGRIGTALGFDRNKVQSAISSAVPSLLAAFNNVATQPGGAQKLADAARQQTGSLGNFASVLATGEQSSLLDKGSQLLSSLVGGQNQNALIGAIAKFTGLGPGRKWLPAWNAGCDKVLAIPGVAEVLKPSVDTLKAKLTALVA
jgi:hypothetical protein